MLPTVSVIVPARNEEKVIGNCINSLLRSDYPKNNIEIVVAIDGSTDRTNEIVRSYGKKIKIVFSHKPKKCKGDAINGALRFAKGDIIGIYDADCIVSKSCIRRAVERFEDKSVSGVSGTIKSTNKNQNIITRALSLETCSISYTEHILSSLGMNSIFFGRNMFIRKSVLRKLGNFSSTSIREDGNLNIDMRRRGYKIVFEPRAMSWTEEAPTLQSFVRQRTRWTRGIWTMVKDRPYKSVKDFFSDSAHTIPYYPSPLFAIIALALLMAPLSITNMIYLSPILLLFAFSMFMIVGGKIYYKESLKDLLLLPVFFFLGGIMAAIFIKTWFDEKAKKKMSWLRPDRTGIISK